MNRLVSLILIVGAFGIFFAYVHPTYTGPISILRSEVGSLDRTLATAQQFRVAQARLVVERENMPQDQLERLKTLLPDNVDNVQLILDVDGVATRHGVRITDIGVEERDADQVDEFGDQGIILESSRPYASLDLTFSAIATYQQFKDFLRDLERSLRVLDVVGIEFRQTETGVYTFDVAIRVYWLR